MSEKKGGRKPKQPPAQTEEPKAAIVIEKSEAEIIEKAYEELSSTQEYDDSFFNNIKEQVKYAYTPRRVGRFGRRKRRSYVKLRGKLRRTIKRRSIKKKY